MLRIQMKSIGGKFLKVQTGKEQHETAAGVDKQTDSQRDGQTDRGTPTEREGKRERQAVRESCDSKQLAEAQIRHNNNNNNKQ